MKILIVQTGDAESILLATPLMRCIKKQLPYANLHGLVLHTYAHLLSANLYINQLHLFNFNSHTTVAELKAEAFDYVINLAEDANGKAIVEELQAPLLHNHQKGFKAFLNRLFSSNKLWHPAEHYLQQAAALGVVNDGAGLDYFIPHAATVPYADIPASHHAGFITLAVSAAANQSWQLLMLQQLVTAIHHPIILIGSETERVLAEKVKATDDIKVYNACGKFNTHETADLVRKSKLLVASPPYYVQLAAALDKELVWMHTTGSTAPYYGQHFTKSKAIPVYDKVTWPPIIYGTEKASATAATKAINQLVNEIATAVRQRLKGKA